MKESVWGYWIVVLGISILSIMVVVQNYTTTKEQDYFMMNEVMEAAMYESVDYGYYRDTGIFKMNTEKFVENFIRRFSETVNINKNYQIDIYQVYENPPAASVSIKTKTDASNFGDNGATSESDVVNRLTGILYTNSKYQPQT